MKNKILIVGGILLLIMVASACSMHVAKRSGSPTPKTEVSQIVTDSPQTESSVGFSSSGVEINRNMESERVVTSDADKGSSFSEKPVTESSVTKTPVTEKPIMENPVTESPVTEKPVMENPVTENPVTENPVTESPVTENPVTENPVTESPVTESPVTESPITENPVINYDINIYLDFARSYAQSIGLALDSTATDCWDNPISANPNLSNVDENISSRLNRYKNTDGFTAVWIWAVQVSDNGYQIYIGYA